MRQQQTFFLLVLLTVLGVITASAFEPGPDIIRECPKCNAALKQETMLSGNTFGAQFWTDGKMDAPMRPDYPWLVKCPKCGTLFWIDESKKLGERWYPEKTWPDAIDPSKPTEADLLSLLGAEKLPKEKELYVRRRSWWAANDAIRWNEEATSSLLPAQEANLQVLANLMDERKPDERLTKAEIFRELKKFDDCIALLTQPFDDARKAEVAAFIKKLAEQKFWTVREIIKQEAKPNKRPETH